MESIYRRGGRTIFAFRRKALNYIAQPSLQLLIREIGIRRTDYLHFPQFRTGQEPFPLSADQCQFKELRINAVIQINQLSDLLLYGDLQTRTKLLDGILYLGKEVRGGTVT